MSNNYCNDSDKISALTEKLLKEKATSVVLDNDHIKKAIDHCCKNENLSDEEFEKCVYNTLGLRY